MLLVHIPKVTPRADFVFKHICTRILGIGVGFTSVVEEFIAHQGPKLAYGKSPLGSELFIKSHGLLERQGVEDVAVTVEAWDDTVGFFKVGKQSVLPFDIFAASFYLLSRYEEYLPHLKDEKGRFPASESLAGKHGFLDKPVVDIWAYKLLESLEGRYPDLERDPPKPCVHTLVTVEEPFRFAQKGPVRSLVGFWLDLRRLRFKSFWMRLLVLLGAKDDPLDIYSWLVDIQKRSRNAISLFFMVGDHHQIEKGFNMHRRRFESLIKFTADYHKLGLLLSTYALEDNRYLLKEKKALEDRTHRSALGSLNFDYLVKLPERYRKLVEGEIQRDFSMVYEDTPGFRAGTCTPLLFYDLDYEIKTPLIIHPLAFTTQAYNRRYESDSLQQITAILNTVQELGGTFSIVFRNEDLTDTPGNSLWRSLLADKLHADE